MSRFEKLFVNSASHSLQVARRAAERLALASPQPGARYLDVGCGNGAATRLAGSAWKRPEWTSTPSKSTPLAAPPPASLAFSF